MTEERSRYYAKALARCIGVTFYAVRSREGRFLAVQIPSDDCEILAEVTPPGSGRLHWAAGEPSLLLTLRWREMDSNFQFRAK